MGEHIIIRSLFRPMWLAPPHSDMIRIVKNQVHTFLCKTEFSQWLETKDDDTVVGSARSAKACPIANFLKLPERHGNFGSNVSVEIGIRASIIRRSNDFMRDDNRTIEVVSMPNWASKFVRHVDKFPVSKITAVDARLILKRV